MNNMNRAPAQMITALLDHLSQESVQRWGANLVSVVLFGSLARGDAHQHSDIDVLLVVRNLPQGWRERSTLELSFERLGLQWGKPLQVILVEPAEVRLAVDDVMPFLLEMREGYRCLFDRDEFFQTEMKRLEGILVRRGVRRLAEHKWEVPERVK